MEFRAFAECPGDAGGYSSSRKKLAYCYNRAFGECPEYPTPSKLCHTLSFVWFTLASPGESYRKTPGKSECGPPSLYLQLSASHQD